MTVLKKFFVSRGVKLPAHSRVGKFRCGPTRSSIHETPHQKKFRTASLNVGTLRGISSEVVETMSRRSLEAWVGNEKGTDGVGILLSEE